MIPQFVLVAIGLFVALLSGYAFKEHIRAESLYTDVKNRDEAIVAYEQLLKVAPLNAVNKKRKEGATHEINATLSNSDSVDDGNYSL